MYAHTVRRPDPSLGSEIPGVRHLSGRRRRVLRLRVVLLAAMLTATLAAGLAPLHDSSTSPYVAGAGGMR